MKPMSSDDEMKTGEQRMTGGRGMAGSWWSALGPAIGVVALLFVVRVVYLLWLSPYSLAEDEAFYWEWSKHLAWSYNTKGPGIAWAMWLATSVLGDTTFAVRMVAVVSSALGAIAAAGMACELTRGNRVAGVLAALGYNCLPAFAATALLSTIDGPYLACWAWACWLGVRAMTGGSGRAWLGLGVVLGIGFLFKYTILLLPLGMAVFAWRHRGRVSWPARGWMLGCAAGFAIGLLPVLIWNAQHEWVTVKHLLGHLGIKPSDVAGAGGGAAAAADAVAAVAAAAPNPKNSGYNPMWTLELIGIQLGIIGPALIAMGAGAVRAWRGGLAAGRDARAGLAAKLMVHASWPVLGFYLLVTLKAQAEGNWPMAGFVSLLPLAAAWVVSGRPAAGESDVALPSQIMPGQGLRRFTLNATGVVGLVVGLGLARLDVVHASLMEISPAAARVVPIGRVTGNEEMAGHIGRIMEDVQTATGKEPFVLSQSYGRASQLCFAMPGHPVVYVAQSRLGGRAVQQDYWPSHDVDSPALKGRPAVIIADFDDASWWKSSFERVERIGEIDGAIRAGRFGFVGYGFKGLPARRGEAF